MLNTGSNRLTGRAAEHCNSPPREAAEPPSLEARGCGPWGRVWVAGLAVRGSSWTRPSRGCFPTKPQHSPVFQDRPAPRADGARAPPAGGAGPRRHRRAPAAPLSLPPAGVMSPPLFSLPEARLRFTVSLPRLPPALPSSFQPSLLLGRQAAGPGCASAPPGPRPGRSCCRERPGRCFMER